MKIKLYILSFFLIFSCENIIDNTVSEKDYIHPNTQLLVRIKYTNKFKNSFKNNEYLNSLLVKKDNKIPYLVDQHLLENDNAEIKS